MATPFQVDVVSPEAKVWSGEATFLIARTPEGEIGVMAGHEPVMGALETGAVVVTGVDGSTTTIGVHGGFLQILDNQVTLLTDRATVASGGKDEAAGLAEQLKADAVEEEALEA